MSSSQPTHPSGDDPPILRMRITHITSTMSPPLPTLTPYYTPSHLATAIPPGSLPSHVPVIRLFGTTPALQKVCANVHLCYPYFYVPFPMDSTSSSSSTSASALDPLRPERVVKLCQRFAVSLNHAICLAMRQNPTSNASTSKYGGGADPRHLHVASVMLVKGTPFYGYHIGWSYFLKVSLVNPSRMYVALEQLRKPVVLGREWQPHEAHMNHVLQFMCDFDLYGCGWMDLGGGTFREPLPEGDPYASPPRQHGPPPFIDSLTVPLNMIYPASLSPPKDTYTPLEIDVLPQHILNRRRLRPRNLHHDFIELLHAPLDPDEKLVPAVAELWEDERRRRAAKGLSLDERAMMPGSGGMGGRTRAELGYLSAKAEDEAKVRDQTEGKGSGNKGGDWKISDELWGMIEERMRDERRRKGRLGFERFSADVRGGANGEKRRYDKWIMTTFEAVSAHWPKPPRPPRSTQRSRRSRRSNKASSVVGASSSQPVKRETSPHQNGHSFPLASPPESPSDIKPGSETMETKPDVGQDLAALVDVGDWDWSSEGEDEDENPFEAFAMTQASQSAAMDIRADVNRNVISRAQPPDLYEVNNEDADDPEEQERARHQLDAKQHAEEGVRFRATQAPARHVAAEDGEVASGDEYDDEAMDELFRKTVLGGLGGSSAPSTPHRRGSSTSASTSRSYGMTERKARRDLRMRDQAGWGDLSIIVDRSSVPVSSPTENPFDTRPRTPFRAQAPVSDRPTPTSMVRNLFARNRPGSSTAAYSPTRRLQTPGTTGPIVLPESRRSVNGWGSPSPEEDEDEEREESPTPMAPKEKKVATKPLTDLLDVKPKIEPPGLPEKVESESSGEKMPAAQQDPPTRSTMTTSGESNGTSVVTASGKRVRMPSPTLRDEPAEPPPTAIDGQVHDPTEFLFPPRKRVRLATPPPSTLRGLRSQPSQPTPASSGETKTSTTSVPSNPPTDGDNNSNSTLSSRFSSRAWQIARLPPSCRDVAETIEPEVVYQEPYYSNPSDVPSRPKMFAGKMFALGGATVGELEEFEGVRREWLKRIRVGGRERARWGWEFAKAPPRGGKVVGWCEGQDREVAEEVDRQTRLTSQLEKPTQETKYGFKFSQKKKTKDSEREHQNMSVLALEVFATSRHQLLPDPEKDALTGIFYCYQNEDDTLPDTTIHPGYYAGYAVVDSQHCRSERLRLEGVPCHVLDSELDLINWLIDLVKGWDPDVLSGWELHNSSWGYAAARANEAFGIDLMEQLSRVVSGHSAPKKDFYSATHTSTFKVSGRHVLNIWRICRSEINLTQYTFENVAFHLLHQRIPHYHPSSLTALWKSKTPAHTWRVLKYFFQRVVMYSELIDAAEIITKNAEFARVFGVDFASVMFRGSQFKVESFMFRIAKPESFVLVSPSKQQVGLQNAPFAVPLIAEPESKYYNHPILVLDFQSLYPSVMIAYNICFSTCLGRVEKFKGTDKFGFTELKVADGLLELLKDYLTVTPNGMIFVKPCVRKSLLAKMLGEILDTRVMVKQAMKGARGDKSLLQLLNARQLGLKLMANVTYGYTSATYSGRMPCIEVADSIVQTGRETLEKAQELIHSRADWGAQVVYGDTDSLFVALPGRSKEQAFKIGNDIADTVTSINPKPVKLKFEKVYMGSVLMAKKRYVGFKYEHPDEKEPVFDAKGIETIRRDGFPAQQKIEELCLKMLFRTQDLSEIKEFCRQEWTKILQGRVSIQDFIVAKEVRLGSYSEKGVPPPGAAVAYRRILKDPRDEPQYAERVPYIVSNTEGRRLIDRARTPEEMLANRSLGIDAEYYIRNLLIPPLSRIFNLVGADVEGWYDSMPRTKRAGKYDVAVTGGGGGAVTLGGAGGGQTGRMRIDAHFRSSHCIVCGGESTTSVCRECTLTPSVTSHTLLSRLHIAQSTLLATQKICASCSGTPPGEKILCDSVDCPVLYKRVMAGRDVEDLQGVEGIVSELDEEGEGEDVSGNDPGEWREAMDW